ncbi:MAG: TerB family tellurite resistance protein [Verrucomicrobiota bacterium]
MSDKPFVIDLAKLVICAAWADEKLSHEEMNALKDLLFNLDYISGEDWAILNMYLESPVTEEETNVILQRVLDAIRTPEDKTYAVEMLEHLFQSDGEISAEETAFLEKIKGDISEVKTGLFAGLSKALTTAVGKRRDSVQASCLRENDSTDYIENTVFYDLKRRQAATGLSINKSEDELRKICFATGLLAHIAYLDEDISQEEQQAMKEVLAEDWNLAKEEADILVHLTTERANKGLDYFRLSHGYFECTSIDERKKFLVTLFRIANATNHTDNEEIEEIRAIGTSLKIAHKDFINAKLTISREDRGGL